jgi:hypothetical protein
MSDVDNLAEVLDELTIEQLEQLDRLLVAVRRYMPNGNLSDTQKLRRQDYLKNAVARLRAGLTNDELDSLIKEINQAS